MTIDEKIGMTGMELRRVLLSAHKTILEATHEGKSTFRASQTMKELSTIITNLKEEDFDNEYED